MSDPRVALNLRNDSRRWPTNKQPEARVLGTQRLQADQNGVLVVPGPLVMGCQQSQPKCGREAAIANHTLTETWPPRCCRRCQLPADSRAVSCDCSPACQHNIHRSRAIKKASCADGEYRIQQARGASLPTPCVRERARMPHSPSTSVGSWWDCRPCALMSVEAEWWALLKPGLPPRLHDAAALLCFWRLGGRLGEKLQVKWWPAVDALVAAACWGQGFAIPWFRQAI